MFRSVFLFIALAVGAFTIFSMTKIWAEAFWTPHPDNVEPKLNRLENGMFWPLILPIAGLAVLTCIIGLFPEPFVQFAEGTTAQLLDPTAYIEAVLGGVE